MASLRSKLPGKTGFHCWTLGEEVLAFPQKIPETNEGFQLITNPFWGTPKSSIVFSDFQYKPYILGYPLVICYSSPWKITIFNR
jgi:hypothetical protein